MLVFAKRRERLTTLPPPSGRWRVVAFGRNEMRTYFSNTLRVLLPLAVVGAMLFVASVSLRAQAVGEITGTVTDPSGALVPNVRVTAKQPATGASRSTLTSSSGTYTLAALLVGTYTVTAEAHGFKSAVAQEITLDVAQQRRVDFTLALAGVQSTVEVNAAPPLLNTTTGTIAGLVSAEQVENLPINGRDITALVFLEPGMAPDTGNMGWQGIQPTAPSMWISNGNRGETMVGTLDDSDVSDPEMGSIEFTNFNFDAIAEFKVQQNNYSAQYGQGAGTITQIVSKSGSDQFHGSAFDFVRNSAFDARNFFATSVPPYRRNEFGTTFGGPILKEKTFFFVEYAGMRQRLGEPVIVPVPTTAERAGIVTITGSNGQPDELQVPLNPTAQVILNRYPMPNQPDGIFGANTFNFMHSAPTNDDQFSARVDHHLSTKDTLFARASYINNIAGQVDAWAAEMGGAGFSSSILTKNRNYAIAETHLFSPTLLNSFNFTLNRTIEGLPLLPESLGIPTTVFWDGSLANWGPDTFSTLYVVSVFDPKDNVSWIKGRQSLNIGGEVRREWDNCSSLGGVGPAGMNNFNAGVPLTETIPSINGGAPLLAGTGSPSGMISMMEGDIDQYERTTVAPGYGPPVGMDPWLGVRRTTLAGYFQDDIKATSKLTFNLGLRYEMTTVPTEVGDRLAQVGDTGSLYGRVVLNPQPLWLPDRVGGDFGPRIGFAVDLGKKTVLRGGFGIFTNMIPTVYPDQSMNGFPNAMLSYNSNAVYSLTPQPVSLPPLYTISGQPAVPGLNTKNIPPNTPVNIAPYAAILGPLALWGTTHSFKNGYTTTGNLTLEHEFPGGVAVQASYVADDGISLYNSVFPNAFEGAEPQYTPFSQITQGLTEVCLYYNGAHSDYNALQVQARKISPSHGLTFQANYTWAKNMTDADDVWSASQISGAITPNNPFDLLAEYARASFDLTQRFVANFEYDLPLGHWQALSPLPRRVTQGWQVLGIFSARSGSPFNVITPYGTVPYGYDDEQYVGTRPNFLQRATLNPGGGPQFFSSAVIGSDYGFNTGFFGTPTVASPVNGLTVLPAPGNLGRNTFTGPGASNLDFSVIKETRITESKMLQFRAEFFNILNLAPMGTPCGGGCTLGAGNFGYSVGTATVEREIQLGLRFVF